MAIQKDSSLTASQKLRKIQELMYKEKEKPAYKFEPKEDSSFQDAEKTILGCKHYRRKCKIQANCCKEWMVCRLCHNDNVSDHEINRYETETMMCMLCKKEQPVAKDCVNCEESMADYFCSFCKFFDSTPGKNIFHCDKCKMCRVGKKEDYEHCDNCGICLHISLMNVSFINI